MAYCWKYYLLRALRSTSVFPMVQRQVVQGGQDIWSVAKILPSKSIAFYFSVPHGATASCPRRASCMAYCWKYYLLKALRSILVFRMVQQQVVQGGQDVWLVT